MGTQKNHLNVLTDWLETNCYIYFSGHTCKISPTKCAPWPPVSTAHTRIQRGEITSGYRFAAVDSVGPSSARQRNAIQMTRRVC